MQIWSNTTTLDGCLPGLRFTKDPRLAEVALIGGKTVQLAEFPRLRGLFKTGVGRDNVPEEEARRRGIRLGFPSPGTCAIIYDETASFTCHLILECLYAEVGDWAQWQKRDRPALASRTLLVIGTGNIGRRVVDRMRPFLRVTTYDTLANEPRDLEPLMRQADVVSLHVPLTPATKGFFDADKLAWLKDGAALVNTARGAVVDEDALYRELSAGRLRAAFDVFWQEPYRGPLTELPPDRFLVSPHVASTCRAFVEGTARDFRYFLGEIENS
ncbi:hydroxyacid dehydrogenase [bacterium]|nr:hydroxyacid dehydrogenase [bacterium]